MNHSALYRLPDGTFKASGSYSARDTFKFCKRKFLLQRVRGWQPKRQGASMDFGKIVEDAVVWHYQHGGSGGREQFLALWDAFKLSKDFDKKEYARAEVSWENCRRIGDEWMRIFAARFKAYPLANAKFQVPLSKKVFPGTSYDAIRNVAYLDIYAEVDQRHPLLVPLKTYSAGLRPIIIDIKTSSKYLNALLVGLDPQLIEYAWMYKVPDVGFLWFLKQSHGYKFKSRVTLLEDSLPFKAGDEVIVLEKDGDGVWCTTPKNADKYEKLFTRADNTEIKGKAATALAVQFYSKGYAVRVPAAIISKQLVQFAAARITPQAMEDMGKVVGQTTVEMVVAHETGFYPMEPGIRYPSEKCNRCDMRFICAGDKAGQDKFLVRIGQEPVEGDSEDLEEGNRG